MTWFKRQTGEVDASGEKRVRTEGLWVKCDSCRKVIWKKDLEENMNVCPHCDRHFRIDARTRLAQLLDNGQYDIFDDALASTDPLQFADLTMNVDTHEVWRSDQAIELTATEFNLLRYLLENARRVISKSELLDNVWGFDFHGDPNIVETYISYLRKKIDDREPALIHTIRRVGYTLRLPREG